MKKLITKKVGLGLIGLFIGVTLTGFRYDFFEIAKQIEIYNSIFKEINMGYVDKTNPAQLMENGVKHMLTELDPYTVYSTEQDVQDAKIYRSGIYVGIGAKMRVIEKKLFVEEVFKGLSTDKAGLKAGDEIIKINNLQLSESFEQAKLFLNGKNKSSVLITYKRDNTEKQVELIREEKKQKAVPLYQMLENNVGYIALDKFSRSASSEVESALKFLLIDEAEGLILDLRNNPGGLLQEAVKIVNLFVAKNQLVVSTRSNIEQYNNQFITQKQPVSEDIPLVVLINERSASASEIVAGALQDLDRAVIIGSRSFGKGLVQQPKPLPYGAQLKITISRYFTPSGRCIQALDYRQRTGNGEAQKRNESDYKAFKTKNGRTVYDGGGVRPDIEIVKRGEFDLINNLKKEHMFFLFATDYCRKNSLEKWDNFMLDESIFKSFKEFCLQKNFSLGTKTEKYLNRAYSYSLEEGLKNINSSLIEVKSSVRKEKILALEASKEKIMNHLSEEIVKNIFYKEGLYQFSLVNNKGIQTAKSLLKDPKEYYSLLK
ncbi:S41 family peptidase [Flavobacteriaceae bacterium]|jgi:carboxyl-terminal processing protease|nr:S41 family peptidase [Flavobacteriaceae bacterium]MDA9847083.1 S41 family peptidase [Flavobacteriaceae bacterium]